jgi:hypothetical protein
MHAQPSAAIITDDERADLEKLANELSPHGCKTVLVTGDSRAPTLDVLNGNYPSLRGRIYAQADHFWWSHAEPIAPRDHIPDAAQAIAHTLATHPHD